MACLQDLAAVSELPKTMTFLPCWYLPCLTDSPRINLPRWAWVGHHMPVLSAHQSLASGSLNEVPGRTFLISQVLAPSPAEESCLSTTAFPMKVKVKVTQSCWTLCNPMDYTVLGIHKARILEWVAFPFSRGSSQPRDQTHVSCIAGGFFTNWAIRKPYPMIRCYNMKVV